jgi:hypothetical protein
VLHLIKLAVGARDLDHLRAFQAERAGSDPPLRHRTRTAPRRAAEIAGAAGGSIYWVVNGYVQVRQRILDIREDRWDDGSACAGLVLDPNLVPVQPRPVKPFQGWRYLTAEAAPADAAEARVAPRGLAALPPALRQELHSLGLL